VFAEALSTTSAGLGIRNITFTKTKKEVVEDPEASGTQINNYSDPILCQRISTPSSLGVELGAGGCVHGGGAKSFAHSIGANLQLIYYPFASRTNIDNDDAIRLRRQFFGDLYISAQGGFVKITHAENKTSDATYSTDALEFGGGIGWTYRLTKSMALGLEGNYLMGSIMSTTVAGSTNLMMGTMAVTVFL
jgi:hypothetical protein